MTWLAPWMFSGVVAALMVVTTLHFIAWDRPQPSPLPTARFVPDPRDVPAARRRRLVDLLLLALRALTILLIGAAFAHPVLTPARRGAARIVVLDRSRGTVNPAAALDSTRAWRRDGDPLLVLDSVPGVRGSVSAALIMAVRAAAATQARPESSEIVLVSPLLVEELDEAASEVRAVWPGSLRLVRVPGPQAEPARREGPEARGSGDDAVAAAAALVSAPSNSARFVRGALTPADSAFAVAGGTLIHWPLVASGRVDGALVGEHSVAIASFIRPDGAPTAGRTVVLRWSDGSPAATESAVGEGCIRTVHAGVPDGDAALKPRFLTLVRDLAGRCTSSVDPGVASAGMLEPLTRRAAIGKNPRPALASVGLSLAPFLFVAALITALIELFVRRRR